MIVAVLDALAASMIEKPLMVSTLTTPSIPWRSFAARSATAMLRSIDAPSGRRMLTMPQPSSSGGTNPVGSDPKPTIERPIMPPKTRTPTTASRIAERTIAT